MTTNKNWKAKLIFNAIYFDSNGDRLIAVNVLGDELKEKIHKNINNKKLNSYNDLADTIHMYLTYHYWCRTEYELNMSGLFKEEQFKVDIYSQVMINFELIVDYVNNTLNLGFKKEPLKIKPNLLIV